mgnify:CR=1 FL=1
MPLNPLAYCEVVHGALGLGGYALNSFVLLPQAHMYMVMTIHELP